LGEGRGGRGSKKKRGKEQFLTNIKKASILVPCKKFGGRKNRGDKIMGGSDRRKKTRLQKKREGKATAVAHLTCLFRPEM